MRSRALRAIVRQRAPGAAALLGALSFGAAGCTPQDSAPPQAPSASVAQEGSPSAPAPDADASQEDQGGQAIVTYLGNEAVLATGASGRAVLFDPLFHDGAGQYQQLPDDMRADLIAGEPPFDRVEAVFVSHAHADHFVADDVVALLRARPGVRLFAPPQVVSAIGEAQVALGADVLDRVVALDLSPGDASHEIRLASGLTLDAVALPHAGGDRHAEVENIVFRVTLDASSPEPADGAGADSVVRITHLGDAAADRAAFAASQAYWAREATDLALPPYWFYLSDHGQEIMANHMNARAHVGIHAPGHRLAFGEDPRASIDGDIFVTTGEMRRVAGSGATTP